MKKVLRIIPLLLLFVFLADHSAAQLNRKAIKKNNKRMRNYKGAKNTFDKSKRYNSIGITLNSLNYFGDLAPKEGWASTDISFTRPGFGASFSHRFGPRYTLTAEYLWGTLKGNDFESADASDENAQFRYVRNLSFRNRVNELTVKAVFDAFKNESSYITRVTLTPYAYAGVSLIYHNPKGYVHPDSGLPEAGTWVALQPLGTEGQFSDLDEADANFGIKPYSRIQIGIPFGIGARYKLNQAMDFAFEIGTRYLFTDYIDDVSTNYVDQDNFDSDLAWYMSDRSRERTDAASGAERDLNQIANTTGVEASGFDTNSWLIQTAPFGGFGQQGPAEFPSKRGGSGDNDIYWVTTLKVSYILGGKFMKAKFR